jgi:MFS transporter, CP family, cyanate transporter
VIAAGVVAALHVGKLPPAVPALQAALGLTLVQAGFLLSMVQLAGMSAGAVFGVLADGLGLRRSMLLGLALLVAASSAGALAQGASALMALRALEGFGFLLVVLPAPGLVRRLVPPARMSAMLGVWGAYMPLATTLALLLGPLAVATLGWRWWWGGLALVTGLMALLLARALPAEDPAGAARRSPWAERLARTLKAPGPWLVALSFAMYSGQWLAVVGFLPVICAQLGLGAGATGVLSAGAAAVNMVGNVTAGRLLQRGWPAVRLLRIGFAVMAAAALLAFAGAGPLPGGEGTPPLVRYAAVLAFSMFGGLIPATLFALSVRLAPGEDTISSTVGFMQQWSAAGQFAGPPLVAWVASAAGGWQFTWVATGACCALGLGLSLLLARRAP